MKIYFVLQEHRQNALLEVEKNIKQQQEYEMEMQTMFKKHRKKVTIIRITYLQLMLLIYCIKISLFLAFARSCFTANSVTTRITKSTTRKRF